jgi:hypothetical protein
MRVTRARATICGGIAIAVSTSLPVTAEIIATPGQQVPVTTPATTPASGEGTTAAAAAPPYEVAWNVPIAADGPLTLAVTRSSLVIGGPEAPVEARSPTDGSVTWKSAVTFDGSMVVEDGLIFGVAGGTLAALDETSGRMRWSAAFDGQTQGPTTRPGIVLISAGSLLYAYRTADGAGAWGQDVRSPAVTRVAASDEMAVVALADGTMAAFDLQTGRPRWREPLDVAPSALVIARNRIYMATAEKSVCAYRTADGRLAWCFPVRVPSIGDPVVDDRYLYAAFQDNTLRIFDRNNGALVRSVPLNALPVSGPWLAGTLLALPVHTTEFVFLNVSAAGVHSSPAIRLSTPAERDSPSALAAGGSNDGSLLAMLTRSPAERLLVCFRRSAPKS